MPNPLIRVDNNTLLRYIWESISGSGNSTTVAASVGITDSGNSRLNPATSELQTRSVNEDISTIPVTYNTPTLTGQTGVGVYFYNNGTSTSSLLGVVDPVTGLPVANATITGVSGGSSTGGGIASALAIAITPSTGISADDRILAFFNSSGNLVGGFNLSTNAVVTIPTTANLDFVTAARTSDDIATAANTTSIPLSTTLVTLSAANTNRKSLTIYNDSDQPLYILIGNGIISTALFTDVIEPSMAGVGGYYELPKAFRLLRVTGIWETAGTGQAMVTEGF